MLKMKQFFKMIIMHFKLNINQYTTLNLVMILLMMHFLLKVIMNQKLKMPHFVQVIIIYKMTVELVLNVLIKTMI